MLTLLLFLLFWYANTAMATVYTIIYEPDKSFNCIDSFTYFSKKKNGLSKLTNRYIQMSLYSFSKTLEKTPKKKGKEKNRKENGEPFDDQIIRSKSKRVKQNVYSTSNCVIDDH